MLFALHTSNPVPAAGNFGWLCDGLALTLAWRIRVSFLYTFLRYPGYFFLSLVGFLGWVARCAFLGLHRRGGLCKQSVYLAIGNEFNFAHVFEDIVSVT
jgi:hypothetical protein